MSSSSGETQLSVETAVRLRLADLMDVAGEVLRLAADPSTTPEQLALARVKLRNAGGDVALAVMPEGERQPLDGRFNPTVEEMLQQQEELGITGLMNQVRHRHQNLLAENNLVQEATLDENNSDASSPSDVNDLVQEEILNEHNVPE